MAEQAYQYTNDDAHRMAGIHAGWEMAVETTTVLGQLPSENGIPVFVVYVEGNKESHGYWYPAEVYFCITWEEDGMAVIDEATDEQIESCK